MYQQQQQQFQQQQNFNQFDNSNQNSNGFNNNFNNGQQQQQQQMLNNNNGNMYNNNMNMNVNQNSPEEQPIQGTQQNYQLTQDQLNNVYNNQTSKQAKKCVDFDSLPNFPQGTDLNQIAQNIMSSFNGSDWQVQFDCIDSLRIFNKYYYENINDIFKQLGSCILSSIENPKTILQKNTLYLVREIYHMQSYKPNVILISDFTETFVPLLLKIASYSSNNDIKTTAQKAINDFQIYQCKKDESFIAACKCCFKLPTKSTKDNKEWSHTVLALNLLNNLIKNIGQEIPKLTPETLQTIMKTLTEKMGKKEPQPVVTEAINVCNSIGQLIGQEQYVNLMGITLSFEEHQHMQNCLVENVNKQNRKQQSKENRENVRKSFKQAIQQNNCKNQQKNDEFFVKQNGCVNKVNMPGLQQGQMQQQQQQQQQQNMQFGGSYNQNVIMNNSNNFNQQQQYYNNY